MNAAPRGKSRSPLPARAGTARRRLRIGACRPGEPLWRSSCRSCSQPRGGRSSPRRRGCRCRCRPRLVLELVVFGARSRRPLRRRIDGARHRVRSSRRPQRGAALGLAPAVDSRHAVLLCPALRLRVVLRTAHGGPRRASLSAARAARLRAGRGRARRRRDRRQRAGGRRRDRRDRARAPGGRRRPGDERRALARVRARGRRAARRTGARRPGRPPHRRLRHGRGRDRAARRRRHAPRRVLLSRRRRARRSGGRPRARAPRAHVSAGACRSSAPARGSRTRCCG